MSERCSDLTKRCVTTVVWHSFGWSVWLLQIRMEFQKSSFYCSKAEWITKGVYARVVFSNSRISFWALRLLWCKINRFKCHFYGDSGQKSQEFRKIVCSPLKLGWNSKQNETQIDGVAASVPIHRAHWGHEMCWGSEIVYHCLNACN